ncbi:MAG: DUF1566 domain-containing protein [Myxococcales bacterium]
MRAARGPITLISLASSACSAMLGIDLPDPPEHEAGVLIHATAEGPSADGGLALQPSPYAWARWPMPDGTPEGSYPRAYSSPVEGVVRDDVTKLEWQAGTDSTPRSWLDAETYCAALTVDGGGFRLPARIELVSLLALDQNSESDELEAFPGFVADRYWSASPLAGRAGTAWLVDFGFSGTNVLPVSIDELHPVRCVRGGSQAQGSPFKALSNGVRDAGTRLVWQTKSPDSTYDAAGAEAYCMGLATAEELWRLPTLKELHSLVDETRAGPALDQEAFAGEPSAYYWSATSLARFTDFHWAVDFGHGSDAWFAADSVHRVRCVR